MASFTLSVLSELQIFYFEIVIFLNYESVMCLSKSQVSKVKAKVASLPFLPMALLLQARTVDCFLSFLWVPNGFAYQVPMYELVALQEGHAFTNIIAHF